jgi:hypothetical protein
LRRLICGAIKFTQIAKTYLRQKMLQNKRLVQNAAVRPGQSTMRDHGVELRELRLKLLIDQQKCLQGAVNIAIAPRHDFIDGGLV